MTQTLTITLHLKNGSCGKSSNNFIFTALMKLNDSATAALLRGEELITLR
jgi:hypothetical protein